MRRQPLSTRQLAKGGYLIGMPLLAAWLEAGLTTLGYSVEELESDLLS